MSSDFLIADLVVVSDKSHSCYQRRGSVVCVFDDSSLAVDVGHFTEHVKSDQITKYIDWIREHGVESVKV